MYVCVIDSVCVCVYGGGEMVFVRFQMVQKPVERLNAF